MKAVVIIFLSVFVIVLIALGIFSAIGYSQGTNTQFADVAIFVLTLVGLLVTLASVAMWTTLSTILGNQIHTEISKAEEESRKQSLTRMAAKVADAYWYFYERSGDVMFLEKAIEIADEARKMADGESSEWSWEEERCRIYNNLAYGYAVRGDKKDTACAHYLGEYVKHKAKAFPQREADWMDTLAYVLYRLPKDPDHDKQKAMQMANVLLKRPDIADTVKEDIKARYGI